MKITHIAITLVLALGVSIPSFAQEDIKGVIVGKNTDRGTITVLNESTHKRHTYFLNDQTRITAEGGSTDMSALKRGQTVDLRFSHTDQGREILVVGVPSLSAVAAIAPIETEEKFEVTGEITGVRAYKHTVTIQPNNGGDRLTLHIPKDTQITRRGKHVPLSRLHRGDEVSFHYHDTEQGYVVFIAQAPQPAPVVDTAMADTTDYSEPSLPSTADNRFAALLGAVALLGGGLLLGFYRRRADV